MTIQAKFPGTCSKCGQRFSVGTRIEWTKGQPTRHANCSTAASRDAFMTINGIKVRVGDRRAERAARMRWQMVPSDWTGDPRDLSGSDN